MDKGAAAFYNHIFYFNYWTSKQNYAVFLFVFFLYEGWTTAKYQPMKLSLKILKR